MPGSAAPREATMEQTQWWPCQRAHSGPRCLKRPWSRCGLAGVLTYRVAPGSTGPGQPAQASPAGLLQSTASLGSAHRTVAVSAGLQPSILAIQSARALMRARTREQSLEKYRNDFIVSEGPGPCLLFAQAMRLPVTWHIQAACMCKRFYILHILDSNGSLLVFSYIFIS